MESAHDKILYFSLDHSLTTSANYRSCNFCPRESSRIVLFPVGTQLHGLGYNVEKTITKDQGVGRWSTSSYSKDRFLPIIGDKREIYSSFNSSPIFLPSVIYFLLLIIVTTRYLPRRNGFTQLGNMQIFG